MTEKPIARGLATKALHERLTGDSLNPTQPSIVADLKDSSTVIKWQEEKGEAHFMQERCWAELSPFYGRYGSQQTRQLIEEVKKLEESAAALVCDCGMQAIALVFDILLTPGSHAVLLTQIYNKTKTYVNRLCERIGAEVTIVNDGDWDAIEAAIRPNTKVLFAETFTNPLVRAQDIARLSSLAGAAKLVIDSTIVTPWGPKRPLLQAGVDIVVASGTKALGGQDADLWGYVATNDIDIANRVMDLMAMRGGILDWRRAQSVVEGLASAKENFQIRCHSAAQIAAYLSGHPKVADVFHPSLTDHVDRKIIQQQYAMTGSLLSFRPANKSEAEVGALCDKIAETFIRYAPSFDGLTTKVNHHQSVSEYFTPPSVLQKMGIDKLVRLGVGVEDTDDIIAALRWALG